MATVDSTLQIRELLPPPPQVNQSCRFSLISLNFPLSFLLLYFCLPAVSWFSRRSTVLGFSISLSSMREIASMILDFIDSAFSLLSSLGANERFKGGRE